MAQDPIDEFIALPKDQQLSTLQQLAPDKQDKLLGEVKERRSKPDFTTNEINPATGKGYGTYKMAGPSGEVKDIPYHKVRAASQAQFKMQPEDIRRYMNDAMADPNLNKQPEKDWRDKYTRIEPHHLETLAPQKGDMASELARSYLHEGTTALSNIGAGALGVALHPVATAETMAASVTPRAVLEWGKTHGKEGALRARQTRGEKLTPDEQAYLDRAEELRNTPDPLTGMVASFMPRAVIEYGKAHGREGAIRAKQARGEKLTADEQGYLENAERLEAMGGHPLETAEQMLGQTGVMELGAKVAGKGAATAEAAPKKIMETVTGTGPRQLREMAQKTVEANEASKIKAAEANTAKTKKYLDDAVEAAKETRQRETGYEYDVKMKDELNKAKHNADKAKVDEENARMRAKHQLESKRITDENAKLDKELAQRPVEESKLRQETTDYYAKEDAVKEKAKAQANAAWQPWHEKMAAKQIDGAEIADPLKKITELSPEVTRLLRQLVPDTMDVPPESAFAKERAAVMAEKGITKPYWELPRFDQVTIDRDVTLRGFEPEPIDFNPQPGEAIPAEQVHRAKSILGQNIASGRYGFEGILLGEMKQVYKVLDKAETKASLEADALDDLDAGRKATREYQEAFGRERHTPKTQDEIRKQQANPEQFKEENDQERLDAAKKFDPSLADDYATVKEHRAQIKKMRTPEQLERARKPVPEPPSYDDLRPGYRLKPPPEPPVPAFEKVAQPERVTAKYPTWDEADYRTISPEDLQKERANKIQAFAKQLRDQGVRRTVNNAFYSVPLALTSFVLRHGGLGALELASAPAILTGSEALASLLEKPNVSRWVAEITDRHVAEWNQLPPEQKAVFQQELKPVVETAKAKGMRVAPALAAFVGTGAAAQERGKSIKDLREEAQRRMGVVRQALAPTTETPSGLTPTAGSDWRQPY
jgi:hypothetical protein